MVCIYDAMRPFNRFTKYDGRFGIEIETETVKPYAIPRMKFWNIVPDGSLRNFGQEYVLSSPMSHGNGLEEALLEFEEKTKGLQFLQGIHSTSVHVHINFLNETFLTLANFFTAYALYENLLIQYSGPDRVSNLFCLPIRHAEQIKDNIVQILELIDRHQLREISRANIDGQKYGAINTASFAQRGSVEIRSFRGETDTEVVHKWITILSNLMEYARNQKSPVLIIDHWKERGIQAVSDIFGEFAEELLCEDSESKIKKNLWYAAVIANSSRDWTKFGVFEKPSKKKSSVSADVDIIAMQQFGSNFNELNAVQKILVLERVENQRFEVHPAQNLAFRQAVAIDDIPDWEANEEDED